MYNESLDKETWKQDVCRLISSCLEGSKLRPIVGELEGYIKPGKMLRGLLPFYVGVKAGSNIEQLKKSAAAIELIHVASLLHDDVIDNSELRRGAPAFWSAKGVAGAILLGDLLICKSFSLVRDNSENVIETLISMTEEVCEAEVEQELVKKGTQPDFDECISIARSKTGSLFAFSAYCCGGDNEMLCEALKEAGYLLGTAYQLADDVLDATGDPEEFDKPLGNDSADDKFTLATIDDVDVNLVTLIEKYCEKAEGLLAEWPDVQAGWKSYIDAEFGPVVQLFTKNF